MVVMIVTTTHAQFTITITIRICDLRWIVTTIHTAYYDYLQ